MNVVDSSGWLEYLAGGANADFFSPAIGDTDSLIVPTICLYEVFKRILGQRDEEDALNAVGVMSLGVITELTREIAINNVIVIPEEGALGIAAIQAPNIEIASGIHSQ